MILYAAVVLVLLLKENEAESYVKPHASLSVRHSRLDTGELARLINIINQNDQKDTLEDLDYIKGLAYNDMAPRRAKKIDKNYDTIAPDSKRDSKDYPVKIHIIENPHSLEGFWSNLKMKQYELSTSSAKDDATDYFTIGKLLRRNEVLKLPEPSGNVNDETPKIALRNGDDVDGLYNQNSRENDEIIHFIPSRENRKRKIEVTQDKKHYDYYDKPQLNIFNKGIEETNEKETKENLWDWITKLPSVTKENSDNNYKKKENYNEESNRKENYNKKYKTRYSTKDNYNDDHKYNDNSNKDYNRNGYNKNYNSNDYNDKKNNYFDDYNKKDNHNDDYQNKDVYDNKKIDNLNEYYNEKENYKGGYKEKDDYNDDINKNTDNKAEYKKKDNYHYFPKQKKIYNDANTKEKVKDYYDAQWKSKERSPKGRKGVKSKGNWDKPNTKKDSWDNWKSQQKDTYNKRDWDEATKSSKAVTNYEIDHYNYKELRNNGVPKKEFVPKDTDYYSRPKKRDNFALKPFGRTSIPFAGKKSIYEDK